MTTTTVFLKVYWNTVSNIPPNYNARHLQRQVGVYMFSNRDMLSVSKLLF